MRLDLPVRKPQPRPAGYVTYAVFHFRSGDAGRRAHLQQVATRDLSELSIPDNAYEFYFCDAPPHEIARHNDPLRDEVNISSACFIAREIISGEELRRRLKASGVLQGDHPVAARRDRDGNLHRDDIRHAVWLVKSKMSRYHAVTRDGRDYLHIGRDERNSVIDADKNIMMHWHESSPRMILAGVMPKPPPQSPLQIKQPRGRNFKL